MSGPPVMRWAFQLLRERRFTKLTGVGTQTQALVLVFHCRSLTAACRISVGPDCAVAALEFAPQPDLLWAATSNQCLQCFDATAGGAGCRSTCIGPVIWGAVLVQGSWHGMLQCYILI